MTDNKNGEKDEVGQANPQLIRGIGSMMTMDGWMVVLQCHYFGIPSHVHILGKLEPDPNGGFIYL